MVLIISRTCVGVVEYAVNYVDTPTIKYVRWLGNEVTAKRTKCKARDVLLYS